MTLATKPPMSCGDFRTLMMRQARAGLMATARELGITPDEVFRRFVYSALGYRPDEVEQLHGFCPRCHHEMREEDKRREDAVLIEWARGAGIENVAAELHMSPDELRSRIGA